MLTTVSTLLTFLFSHSLFVGAYVITSDVSGLANEAFSYVIVGGGTAGLAIANRLTENENTTVLVIEAGDDVKNEVRVTDPGKSLTVDVSDLTWGYLTTNQSVGGRQLSLTVGKALGGSSTINGLQWTSGTVAQYDAIEELGNPGWNFASLQNYMKKAEAFREPNADQISLGVKFNSSAHGTSGQVVTGYSNPYLCPECKLWDAFVESTAAVFPGLQTSGDIDQSSGDPRGAARCAYSIVPGSNTGPNAGQNIRSSSASSYVYSLSPSDRPNLQILVQQQATKILWDTTSPGRYPRAKGVAIEAASSPNTCAMVKVVKEVIVSSGSLGSPKFLELSGIGNKEIIKKFGIPVTVDLPAVGTNLQDQSLISAAFLSAVQLNSSILHSPTSGTAAFITLSQMLGKEGAERYLHNLLTTLDERTKDIISSGAGVSKAGVKKMLELQAKQFGEHEAPVVEYSLYATSPDLGLFASAAWILLPQYRGTVHISSSNPHAPPDINPNYLSTPLDFSLLVNASMTARRIYNEPAVKALSLAELAPGASVQTLDEFSSYVLNNYLATLHPIGTVPMLPRELGGAVDPQLRVYGVQGVRVADASIIPLQLSAHLSSTVYGIGEKAADIIKGIVS